MRISTAYFFIFLMLIPVSIPFGEMSGKPIDIVYSDILIVIGLLYIALKTITGIKLSKLHKKLLLLPILVSLFYIGNTSLQIMLRDGSILWLMSTMKFIKPFLIVYFAYFFYKTLKVSPIELLHISAKIASLIVLILMVSELYNSSKFPSPRWGGYFFNQDVYGFPNSPAVFFVFLFSLILSGLLSTNRSFIIKKLYIVSTITLTLTIFFTISRAAILSLLIFLLILFFTSASKKLKIYILFSSIIAICVTYANWESIEVLLDSLIHKFDKTISGNDKLSNRGTIWEQTIMLILERPILGYGFEPFSFNYSGHDTPHQQYLETIYKSGALGFLIFLSFYYKLFSLSKKLSRKHENKNIRNFSEIVTVAFVSILFSNFVQPTLSYSIAGNALIFYMTLLSFYSFETYKS